MFPTSMKTILNMRSSLPALLLSSISCHAKHQCLTMSMLRNGFIRHTYRYRFFHYAGISGNSRLVNNIQQIHVRCTHSLDHSKARSKEEENLTENYFAYKFFKSLDRYPDSIARKYPSQSVYSADDVYKLFHTNWSSAEPKDIAAAFIALSYHAKKHKDGITDEKYKSILIACTENINRFSEEEINNIILCLGHFCPSKNTCTAEYMNFFKALDMHCVKDLKTKSIAKLLYLCDVWYKARFLHRVHCIKQILTILGDKPRKLSYEHLIQFMFYLNLARKPPINMYEIEYHCEKFIDQATVNELGVIAMGFFKTSTPIRNRTVLHKIINKLMQNLSDTHEIALSAILKLTRLSMNLSETSLIQLLLRKLISEVPRLSVTCLVHVAHTSASIQLQDEELMVEIIKKVMENIKECRVKDLERVAFAACTFNYPATHPLYQYIIAEFSDPKRLEEIQRYPKSLSYSLLFLSQVNLYPKHLINIMMDPKFIENSYENGKSIGREYLSLDCSIEIEVPDYTGPRLDSKKRKSLAKIWTKPSLPLTDKMKVPIMNQTLAEVMDHCAEILESMSAVHSTVLLPHYNNPDLVICLDHEKEPISPGPLLSQYSCESIKYPPETFKISARWIVFVIVAYSAMIKTGEVRNKRTGLTIMKMRQLQKIGYTPFLISSSEWMSIGKNTKHEYLRNIINNLYYASSRNVDKNVQEMIP
ncbi:uncharacterized protein LOC105703425 [Orussus abietinus]|uniref:uncharacterized protein LOC105703425 n=1 Tax=Orussus abietinus TaxID=222816 RepID=UPI0006258763|nr:uncharacterized protein LOC105703425 [Orussus abietinus]